MCACEWKANVINTTVSLVKPYTYIFTICHIKAQTHSNTVGIHAPTGDFGQDLQIKNYKQIKR